jgi:flagellar assembly factor FliW
LTKLEIDTKPFGKMEIDERQILEFPFGLLGFEEFRRFALIEESAEVVFKWLQSLEEKNLAFILIQPELFQPNYRPLIGRSELETIGLESTDEALVMVIVSIPGDDPQKMTANLQGPILINRVKKLGRQFISRDETHPVRKQILDSKIELETVS